MNKNDIKRVIGKIEPDSGMESRLAEKLKENGNKQFGYKRWGAIAAGVAFTVCVGIAVSHFVGNKPDNTTAIAKNTSTATQSVIAENSTVKSIDPVQNVHENIGAVSIPETKTADTKKTETVKLTPPVQKPAESTGKVAENEGVYIPKTILSDNPGTSAKMIGLIVYQGRIYTQSSSEIDVETARNLMGEKIGRTKGNITEWSKQDDYAFDLASTVGVQDVYTVKGYDKSFRIMTFETFENGNSYAQVFECLNGITVKTGSDIFDNLKILNNIKSVVYENFESWNNAKQQLKPLSDAKSLNDFLISINKAAAYNMDSVSGIWDDDSADAQKFVHITLMDGTKVQLRLFKAGYVYYGNINILFKVDSDAFKAFWETLK